jgi:hypothetical protein
MSPQCASSSDTVREIKYQILHYSWAVLDLAGNRVKFGNTPSRAEAVLAAEKAIWRLAVSCLATTLTQEIIHPGPSLA